jgi:uncharacterized protein DUF955/uncharacterized protein DUF4118
VHHDCHGDGVVIDPYVVGVPFVTFSPAVIVTTLISGFGAGVFCLVLSTASATFFLLPPYWSFYVESSADVVEIFVFIFEALFYVILITGIRKFGADTIRRNEACGVLSEWFVQTAKYLDDIVNYPEPAIPDCTPNDATGRYTFEEVNEIALKLRAQWGLGPGPISNVLALLESKGIVICRYEMQGESVEAFSFWNGHRPFIFLASEKEAAVRRRYDLSHELGHLVLHRWIEQSELEDRATLKAIEGEADKFAGAFLLPSSSL